MQMSFASSLKFAMIIYFWKYFGTRDLSFPRRRSFRRRYATSFSRAPQFLL